MNEQRDRGPRGREDRGGPRRDDRAGPRRDDRGGPRRDDRAGPRRDDRAGPRRDDLAGPRRDERGDSGRDWKERPRRVPEPEVPEDIEAGQLDKVLRAELRTLSKDNADGTARHLVAVGRALDAEDFDRALAHAQAAAKRAGRVAGVRETLGVVHYRRGEWTKALGEFRTARRLSGQDHLLPLMADTERGLGRPERALELAAGPEVRRLPAAEQIEMAIVVSGARLDMGQSAAAVQSLRELVLAGKESSAWAARLRYAYAAALEADGQGEEAHRWYVKAAALDEEGDTDAREVLGYEEDPEVVDLLEGEDGDDLENAGGDRPDDDARPAGGAG